ncbi:deuterosome assembly protein 1 [Sceloporus undulatus]|uniref:deuterosome assembly protein 1 n=1 Tax=Sceloporus undulatus TaxID=8520 RepID=UPI001C4BFD24|nr:deuterosome assembly protein 1 [Sceloporus undulatus]
MEKKIEALREEMVARSVPCDAELQELMQQIDIMVNNKKLEWEKKMQALEARMTIRDQELASAQSKLDQKGQEVGLLRQKLDNLQKTKYEMAQNYDTQLEALKTQFAKLTQTYEKLQLHQLKQNKAHDVEKCMENQEVPFQMSSLNQKLEEFRAKSREWDKQETLYQNHLISLDAQRKLLSEKCNLLQVLLFLFSKKNWKLNEPAKHPQLRKSFLMTSHTITEPVESESEWATQSATYERCRTQIPTWHGQGSIFNSESSCTLPPQRPSGGREHIADGRSPTPPDAYLEHYGTYFPEEIKSDMLLKHIYVAEASQMSSPETLFPATATEKFLQEEDKRAKDFELVLNSHIEELQRQSENTLKKYTGLKQSRHR